MGQAHIRMKPPISTGRTVMEILFEATRNRFEMLFEKDAPSGCWLWKGSRRAQGYGHFTVKCRQLLAHRVAYELWRGEIPAGFVIDHLCRVRHCVNPDHMEVVTIGENTSRGGNALKTHCPKGHPYTKENVYRMKLGKGRGYARRCRICWNAYLRHRTLIKKAKKIK